MDATKPAIEDVADIHRSSPEDRSACEMISNHDQATDETYPEAPNALPTMPNEKNASSEQKEAYVAAEAPYSVLRHGEKAFVIVVGSFAALISPLSSSVYLPALNSLARDMNVSVSLINLTITTYLVRLPNLSRFCDHEPANVLTTTLDRSSRDWHHPSWGAFPMATVDGRLTLLHSLFTSGPTLALRFRTATRH